MKGLITPLLEMEEYSQVINSLKDRITPINIIGPSESQKAHLAFSIGRHTGKRSLVISFNELQAKKLYEDFHCFCGERVVFYPARELLLYDVAAESSEIAHERLISIYKILSGKADIMVTSIEAVLNRLTPPHIFKENIIILDMDARIDLEEFSLQLLSMGYERVEQVEGKGLYSVRGGIVDIFPVNEDYAVRIELFDDKIDSIRQMDTISQRSVDKLESVNIIPAREIIYSRDEQREIIKLLEADLKRAVNKSSDAAFREKLTGSITRDIDRFGEEYYFAGMDRYSAYIVKPPVNLVDYLPDDFIIFLDEQNRIKQRAENVTLEMEESVKGFFERGQILPQAMNLLCSFPDIIGSSSKKLLTSINGLSASSADIRFKRTFNIVSRLMHSYQGQLELLADDINSWKARKNRIIILAGTRGKGERLSETLKAKGIENVYQSNIDSGVLPGQVVITHGSLNKGFEYPLINFVIISDREIFGKDKHPRKSTAKKEGSKLKAFTDLGVGDHVVHQSHGIGQYIGMQKLVVDGITRDYLKVKYQDGGYLYIPTNQLDLIQKYIGSEGKAPKLNKLGGSDWSKTKKRVKESLKDMAGELIRLYAERQAARGHAYSQDMVWQRQFEETFPYEETDGQVKCIEEVKRDMESDRPMDRLLCGDVGYGKTEVAIRAAFKAAMDGKQVAYLVPTTILAQQHYNNFVQRMKDFPVKVEMLSRFRSRTEQKHILKDVKAGNVDILIGTHRLLQKDIAFKDLGLLIVDEEQRFGVTHKEKLKNLKKNIDILTLTATPIPRTLHMSLIGIRDMSIIETPPEERYPVQTYVMEHNDEVMRDAILRELYRKGQVFYLFNRVVGIQRASAAIQAFVPDARIAVAHGQMSENHLEEIMFDFLNGNFDVLVCTTIIESGLDIPNVNTIIVEDSDRMGLSQLYQLRGRVGRSNRLAYAYLMYRRDKVLSEVAEKRLQAIKEFTELGSGFKISMRDLEIRGTGNILGPEQHGHMEDVGYDMYCRLLEEAVRELKGGHTLERDVETTIDINVSAFIDESYIKNPDLRMEMYKLIASIQTEEDMRDVRDELVDRYGDIPGPVRNLLTVAYIKALAGDAGFSSVTEKGGSVILQVGNGKTPDIGVIGKLAGKYKRQLLFNAGSNPYLAYRISDTGRESLLENIKILLQDFKSFAVY